MSPILRQWLREFDVVCVMGGRTPLTREILQQLPTLKLIASTGSINASTDTKAAADLDIAVTETGKSTVHTCEAKALEPQHRSLVSALPSA
jgi:lactate dehydrogenase-like 2-hydroxyacid dehydrogenase